MKTYYSYLFNYLYNSDEPSKDDQEPGTVHLAAVILSLQQKIEDLESEVRYLNNKLDIED